MDYRPLSSVRKRPRRLYNIITLARVKKRSKTRPNRDVFVQAAIAFWCKILFGETRYSRASDETFFNTVIFSSPFFFFFPGTKKKNRRKKPRTRFSFEIRSATTQLFWRARGESFFRASDTAISISITHVRTLTKWKLEIALSRGRYLFFTSSERGSNGLRYAEFSRDVAIA